MRDNLSYQVSDLNLSSANLLLDNNVTKLENVSVARAKALSSLGINNIRDLLFYFPRSYVDFSRTSTISQAKIGFNYCILSNVFEIKEKEYKPGKTLIEITLTDDSGTLVATCFRQKWLLDKLKPDNRVIVAGTIEFNYGFKRITNPFIQIIENDDEIMNYAKILPVYESNSMISSTWIKNIISSALLYAHKIKSPIPKYLSDKYKLMDFDDAINKIHFPDNQNDILLSKRTLKFMQVFMQQIWVLKTLNIKDCDKPVQHCIDGKLLADYFNDTNKSLNISQTKVFSTIASKMASDTQCNLLISCEFIKDKVLMSALAMLICKDSKNQAIMYVPSRVCLLQYKQLFDSIFEYLEINYEFIDENSGNNHIKNSIDDYNQGNIDVLIGTNVLLFQDIQFSKTSLLLCDERHDCSIVQIEKFLNLAKKSVDRIFLTTKAINHNLKILLYPELEHVHMNYSNVLNLEQNIYLKDRSMNAYSQASECIENKGQAVVYCPLLGANSKFNDKTKTAHEESSNLDKLDENIVYDVVSVDLLKNDIQNNKMSTHQFLKALSYSLLSDSNVVSIHNYTSGDIKYEEVLNFVSKKYDCLLCACKIDFNLDIDNNVVFIVEDAEKMSLSHLHQIRNLLLNSSKKCVLNLIISSKQKIAMDRLKKFVNIMDGESLVNEDFRLRRDGSYHEFDKWGLNYLKLINAARDNAIIETANLCAKDILKSDDNLKQNYILGYEISRIFGVNSENYSREI